MINIKRDVTITFILAGLSIFALMFSHLALTDIYHGGEDVSLEWWFLRIAALIFMAFITSTIITLRHVLHLNSKEEKNRDEKRQ